LSLCSSVLQAVCLSGVLHGATPRPRSNGRGRTPACPRTMAPIPKPHSWKRPSAICGHAAQGAGGQAANTIELLKLLPSLLLLTRLGPHQLRQVQLHRSYRRYRRSRCVHIYTRTPCLYDACYGKWPPPLPVGKKPWQRWGTSDQSGRAGTRRLRLMYVLHSRPHSHSTTTSFADFEWQSYKGSSDA
jgi:hypothetical protein